MGFTMYIIINHVANPSEYSFGFHLVPSTAKPYRILIDGLIDI